MNDTTEKIQVTVRLNPETLERIDKARGSRSRQHLIVGSLNFALEMMERGKMSIPTPPQPEPKGILIESLDTAA